MQGIPARAIAEIPNNDISILGNLFSVFFHLSSFIWIHLKNLFSRTARMNFGHRVLDEVAVKSSLLASLVI